MALPLHYKIIASLHRKFARGTANVRFNKFLYSLVLKGLGIDNYENNQVSGESYLLKKVLSIPSSPVLIDIGGFHGEYAIEAFAINRSAQIFVFEPNPNNYQVCQSNLKFSSAKCYNQAVGAANSTLSFYDRSDSQGSQHGTLVKGVIDKLHQQKVKEIRVEVITLDSFILENNIKKVNLLKIDTEGYEYQVLLGAKESLAKGIFDYIQFEFNEMNVLARVFLADFIELLPNYELYRLMPDGLLPIGQYHPLHHEIFGFQNIVAIKKPNPKD